MTAARQTIREIVSQFFANRSTPVKRPRIDTLYCGRSSLNFWKDETECYMRTGCGYECSIDLFSNERESGCACVSKNVQLIWSPKRTKVSRDRINLKSVESMVVVGAGDDLR